MSSRKFSDRPLQPPCHRTQGRGDGVPRHAQHGQGIFFAAAHGDYGAVSLHPLHRTLRRGITEHFIIGEKIMNNLPAWLADAVFYEIYPQSFQDSNGDGIGDIPGMTSRLDYMKELGCNAVWVNPWYDSPFGDAGYDVRDYKKVAPRYGTNEDAKRFFDEAHRRGMHVLIDLVPGHPPSITNGSRRRQSMSATSIPTAISGRTTRGRFRETPPIFAGCMRGTALRSPIIFRTSPRSTTAMPTRTSRGRWPPTLPPRFQRARRIKDCHALLARLGDGPAFASIWH